MEVLPNLPTVKDFKLYGKFYNLKELNEFTEIPIKILYHIFPNYLFIKDNIDQHSKELIKNHCLILKEQAQYEDHVEYLKNLKELQIRRLEDRIHYYHLFKKTCTCSKNKKSKK